MITDLELSTLLGQIEHANNLRLFWRFGELLNDKTGETKCFAALRITPNVMTVSYAMGDNLLEAISGAIAGLEDL